MDDDSQLESECGPEASLEEHDSSPNQYTGAFFHKAKHFVVKGGNFTSIHQTAPHLLPDFPVIPLGHINLLHPIEPHGGSGVVCRNFGRNSVRRLYSARIHGCKSSMAAALYQGEGAEDRWREEVSRYSNLRHPYLAQIYGIVNTVNLHAAVFHDDLIHVTDLLKQYRDSHFRTVFLWACMSLEFMVTPFTLRRSLSSISTGCEPIYILSLWKKTGLG
ncbi:hypothetical protein DFH06DRAFT_607693 [Mycena polygramma]|nr:hypothetical protein DFH06DRAFT_607693 [Mycena polygramma]